MKKLNNKEKEQIIKYLKQTLADNPLVKEVISK